MDGRGSLELCWLASHPALRSAIMAAPAALKRDRANSLAGVQRLAGYRLDLLVSLLLDRWADMALPAGSAILTETRLVALVASSMEHPRILRDDELALTSTGGRKPNRWQPPARGCIGRSKLSTLVSAAACAWGALALNEVTQFIFWQF